MKHTITLLKLTLFHLTIIGCQSISGSFNSLPDDIFANIGFLNPIKYLKVLGKISTLSRAHNKAIARIKPQIIEQIKKIIKNNPQKKKDYLFLATRYNNLPLLQLLLKEYPNLSLEPKGASSYPIQFAMLHNCNEVAEFLLYKKADPWVKCRMKSKKGPLNIPAFMWCAIHNKHILLDTLLKEHKSISKNEKELTDLFKLARSHRSAKVLQLLISDPAITKIIAKRINIENSLNSLFIEAAKINDTSTINVLLSCPHFRPCDRALCESIITTSKKGYKELRELIIEIDPLLAKTLVILKQQFGSYDTFINLCKQAIQDGNIDLLTTILKKPENQRLSAGYNCKNWPKKTLLHYAAKTHNPKILNVLLQYVDANITCKGDTPLAYLLDDLHLCPDNEIPSQLLKCIELVLKHTTKNVEYDLSTYIHQAINFPDLKKLRFLTKLPQCNLSPKTLSRLLFKAIKKESIESTKILLQNFDPETFINRVDTYTPLIKAILLEQPKMVFWLLFYGADPKKNDKYSCQNAIYYAQRSENLEIKALFADYYEN